MGTGIRSRLLRSLARYCESAGHLLIPRGRFEGFALARHLRELFELLEIDCVLDVGANLGQYHDFLRSEVGYAGNVVSFEPIPDHAATLRARARRESNWFIEELALGAAIGESKFHVMVDTQFSSFLEPDHSCTGRFREQNCVQRSIHVQVEVLDDVLPAIEQKLGAKHIYLKLDTQGFDLEVIKGADQTLAHIRALQTEASVTRLYRGNPDYATTIQSLRQRGFDLSGIFPNNPAHFPRMLEFDCVMINARHLPHGRAI
jgi:FkbM family methyltransferase